MHKDSINGVEVMACGECGRLVVMIDGLREKTMQGCGVPEIFASVKPAEKIESLYIYGPNGTGKTTLAASYVRAAIDNGMSAIFVTEREMYARFGDAMGGEGSESAVMSWLSSNDLLVIDDIGKRKSTLYSVARLFDVVDEIYSRGSMLIITSNMSRGELMQRLSSCGDTFLASSIMSRIFEMTRTVHMDGPDRRIANGR